MSELNAMTQAMRVLPFSNMYTMRVMYFCSVLLSSVAIAACGGNSRTVGDERPAPEVEDATLPSPIDCSRDAYVQEQLRWRPSRALERHVGHWTGHLAHGSEAQLQPLELTLKADGSGTFAVGMPREFPEPRQGVGYLCDGESGTCNARDTWLGFTYAVRQVRVDGDRVIFAINGGDPFDAWCRIQIPKVGEPCWFALVESPAQARAEAAVCIRNNGPGPGCGFLRLAAELVCMCTSTICVGAKFPKSGEFSLFDADAALLGTLDGIQMQFRRAD